MSTAIIISSTLCASRTGQAGPTGITTTIASFTNAVVAAFPVSFTSKVLCTVRSRKASVANTLQTTTNRYTQPIRGAGAVVRTSFHPTIRSGPAFVAVTSGQFLSKQSVLMGQPPPFRRNRECMMSRHNTDTSSTHLIGQVLSGRILQEGWFGRHLQRYRLDQSSVRNAVRMGTTASSQIATSSADVAR